MEKHHVKTVPGEHVAPEYPEGGVKVDPGGHAQSDDINVALVGVLVLFFAVFLVVSVIGLQALFYNNAEAEAERKAAPQGSPSTDLGKARTQWDTLLNASGSVPNIVAPGKTDAAGNTVYPKVNVIPIDVAIQEVVKQYGGSTSAPAKVQTHDGAKH